MPYVTEDRRQAILAGGRPENAGDLNYQLTELVIDFLAYHRGYQGLNDVLGVLSGMSQEIYRRIVVQFEDGKIRENGDIEGLANGASRALGRAPAAVSDTDTEALPAVSGTNAIPKPRC